MISTYAGRHFSFCMSIFNAGGTLAFGVGPIIITALVHAYGLRGTLLSMIIGLPLMVVLFKLVPCPEGEGLAGHGFMGSLKEALGGAWKSVAMLWVVMVLRAFVSQAFITFFPILYSREGYSLISIGVVTALFTLAGAFSGLIAGSLADRTRYRPIFVLSHLLTAPALLLSLYLRGAWVYPCAFLIRLLLDGHPAPRGGAGAAAGPQGPFHGVEPDDGAGPGHRRSDEPHHRQAGRHLLPPNRAGVAAGRPAADHGALPASS